MTRMNYPQLLRPIVKDIKTGHKNRGVKTLFSYKMCPHVLNLQVNAFSIPSRTPLEIFVFVRKGKKIQMSIALLRRQLSRDAALRCVFEILNICIYIYSIVKENKLLYQTSGCNITRHRSVFGHPTQICFWALPTIPLERSEKR